MKPIYHATYPARVTTSKGKVWEDTILLQVQRRVRMMGFNFWVTKQELNIEVRDYWVIAEKYTGFKKKVYHPMRMGNAYGDTIEIWKPREFNLEKRACELLEEYVNKQYQQI